MAIWTMVKYRPLEGCVDKFLDGAKCWRTTIPTKTCASIYHVIQITARKTIDQLIDNQDYDLIAGQRRSYLKKTAAAGQRVGQLMK